MDVNDVPNDQRTRDPSWSIWVAGGAVTLLVVAYVIRFGWVLNLPLASDPGDWGAFGDYVGGIVNPLIALMALIWLVESVRIQRRELAATRDELRKAATAQATQVLLAAKTAKISAVSTMLQSVQSEIEQLEAYAARLGDFQLRGGHVVSRSGEPVGHARATVELTQIGVRLPQLHEWKEEHRATLDRESGELSALLLNAAGGHAAE
ncbi:hypothetical protein [Roseateles asaccharophilus]|uniref:Uncharacterized protein n=1 Tax=Roseateles asaccharophilus TaxID=582607 RepID=A0ABU2A471_9BURK|nr:hypothetical protein [Roseateles asaccharophilus]MDR7332003.1 hypothetical protein [Roseateles asaccharophilus]